MLHLKHITLDKKGVLPVVTGLILLFWVTRSFMTCKSLPDGPFLFGGENQLLCLLKPFRIWKKPGMVLT